MTCLSAVIIKENEAGDFFFKVEELQKKKKEKKTRRKTVNLWRVTLTGLKKTV